LCIREGLFSLAFRAQGERAIPSPERDALVLQYLEVLRQGLAEQRALAPPPSGPPAKKSGCKRESASNNLLDALLARAGQVLVFLDDLSIPFANI
jgi:hypothetical protein